MAKLDCQYFPGTPAVWRCSHCSTRYGEKCIPAGHSRQWGPSGPRCIRCAGQLKYLGRATDAKPFWQMLPHFFAYPAHPNSIIVIALIAVFSLALGPNLLSLGLGLFLLAVFIKYSFAIVELRGLGVTTAPSLITVLSSDEHHLFLRKIALFVGMGVMIALAAQVSDFLGFLTACFIAFAMPASIIVLAVEKSVRRALNPLNLLVMIMAIGWPYILLWLCTQVLSAGPVLIFESFADSASPGALMPLWVALVTYFTFVLYTMLGYVLYEYQNELGFNSEAEGVELDRQAFEKARAMGEATVLIQDGRLDQAREALRRALDIARDDIELHLHYHKLLLLLDEPESLANHGNYFVDLCFRQKVQSRAVSVVLDVQKKIPSFTLDNTAHALALAKLLQLQGQHRAIVPLFRDLHKRRPLDVKIPEAYLLMAQTLFEYYGNESKTRQLVDFVLAKYPNCPERPQYEALRKMLNVEPLAEATL